ncbi:MULTISPECIES: PFL_4703 family integrating conjugative element protein [unclassified Gilliamella]|uniref:PFL_4703 family integrating conjugative element protein n=1 Tax=unclassified Gilliamella TaxID=2685620 RepID=UPI00080DF4C6|nr:TIGR03746 family integrating conjugative element protein [Gilliamella apicola]OCG35209.1 integrating conjugative element protein [Gilliamella apicola]OCG50313.1 integrating conjugative element protein [Gilliamella apicola]OCG51732.1 integrating conjugative element protein [Gilliamella apicola]
MKYLHALTGRDKHIQSLRFVIIVLLVIILAVSWGWRSAPKHLTIHIPPDTRSGSTRLWSDIDPSNIYGFAFYIFQQLHNWPTNGEVDYKRNINTLTPFLTPQCKSQLLNEYEERRQGGELRERARNIAEIDGRGINSEIKNYETNQLEPRVKILSDKAWIVTFDLYIDEYYKGEAVKRAMVRYPLSVVKSDTNPEENPWGLKLNCYASQPLRLTSSTGEHNE